MERIQFRRPPENGRAAFSDFSTLRPVFRIRVDGPKTMQHKRVCAKERSRLNGRLLAALSKSGRHEIFNFQPQLVLQTYVTGVKTIA